MAHGIAEAEAEHAQQSETEKNAEQGAGAERYFGIAPRLHRLKLVVVKSSPHAPSLAQWRGTCPLSRFFFPSWKFTLKDTLLFDRRQREFVIAGRPGKIRDIFLDRVKNEKNFLKRPGGCVGTPMPVRFRRPYGAQNSISLIPRISSAAADSILGYFPRIPPGCVCRPIDEKFAVFPRLQRPMDFHRRLAARLKPRLLRKR